MSDNQGLRAAVGWAVLTIVGFAAALSLIVAGQSVGYQHYLPVSQWMSKPVSGAILLVQGMLALVGLRGHAGALLTRARALFPRWRLPALLLAMIGTSAIVGHDIPLFIGELFLSSLVQLVSLCTTVLAVRAIPDTALARLRARLGQLLGDDAPSGDDIAPHIDRFAFTTALAVTSFCLLLTVLVYQRHPHLQDEVAYLFQARTFAEGRVALPNPPVPAAFELYLLSASPQGWYSPVPPGWAVALVPGVLVGAPWLTNPVLTGINVVLLYLVLQPLYGRRVARLSTLLFAASPWNLFLGMSLMPHAFTLFCALAATLGVITARRTGHARWTWLGGLALGMVATVRQLDAMVMAAALGLWAIGLGGRRLKITATAGLVLGSMLVAAPLLLYNKHFTGKAGAFPIMTYNDALYGKGANDYGFGENRGMGWALDPNPGHGPIDGTINTALNTAATQVELFGWSVGSLLLVFAFVVRGRWSRSDRLMLGLIGFTWLAYFFNYFAGGPDFGARYWFLMIVPLAALTARGALTLTVPFSAEARVTTEARVTSGISLPDHTRPLVAIGLLTVGAWLAFIPWRAVDKYWHYRGMRPDIVAVAHTNRFQHALVLISGREIPDYSSAATYNPLFLNDSIPIYAQRTTAASDSAVIRAFQGREVWFVDGPTVSGTSYVVRAGPLSSEAALQHVAATLPSRTTP